MVLSQNLKELIHNIISTQEFWEINYYLRSMKKAPHGGVFDIKYPNIYLKYYPVSSYHFFTPQAEIPAPVTDNLNIFREMINSSNVEIEEILQYCLNVDSDVSDHLKGARLYIAHSGKVIKSVGGRTEHEHLAAIANAIDGKIKYSSNFDIDEDQLIILLILTLADTYALKIYTVNEIVSHEKLDLPHDKYGLSDVTEAQFERQGFRLNEKYYLYNIFLDTSIGGPRADTPRTLEIIQGIKPPARIFMRCDENLSVPYSRKVSTATVDFQKWRGITLDFKKIKEQMINRKETIVHFDPKTLHKILVYIKSGQDENGTKFYHINVEQLWNPNIFDDSEDIIITNYVHGTYYPNDKSFEHIDFSVNQYSREIFEHKYQDAEQLTGISINTYGKFHYKIWCVRGKNLTPPVWSDLVCASLDTPFRKIFLETIGGTYYENNV